jgi:FKBP-type peptidyl-prolyl cis-trans isomerase SlyD
MGHRCAPIRNQIYSSASVFICAPSVAKIPFLFKGCSENEGPVMKVANQKVVKIDYTLTDPKGVVIDTSKGGEPLAYLHGYGGIIPGLESALDGKDIGDAIQVLVQPEQAYGPRSEELIQEVPRKRFPADAKVAPGMQFQAQTPEGPRIVTIVAVEGDTVKLDANHPLAGMPLNFDVKIVDVRDATAEELSHGHVHGTGGHGH